jgi:hypothetical protein
MRDIWGPHGGDDIDIALLDSNSEHGPSISEGQTVFIFSAILCILLNVFGNAFLCDAILRFVFILRIK